MDVRGGYEGLEFRHTPKEVDDETAWAWQDINPSEFIVHAANLFLFRSGGTTPMGVPLWSVRHPSLPEPTLSPG
jgi:hypothetical protein